MSKCCTEARPLLSKYSPDFKEHKPNLYKTEKSSEQNNSQGLEMTIMGGTVTKEGLSLVIHCILRDLPRTYYWTVL